MPIVPSPPVSAPNQPRPSTMSPLSDRRALLRLMSLAPLLPLGACGGGGADSGAAAAPTSATTSAPTGDASAQSGASANATSPARTWKMGFGGAPPLPTLDSLLANIAMWRTRADFTVMHDDLPWAELLAGVPAQTLVQRDKKALVNYYRSLGLGIVFMVDANDGLARGQDAAALRALGRSMTELRVQQLYRDYAVAVAQVLQPDSIGLAPESNLVRAMAPAALYAAIRQAANAAAADVRAAGSAATLLSSVQVETAWGKVAGSGRFVGIAKDLADFPFVQSLGLSSYPCFGYADPADLPADYYSRVTAGSGLRSMVVEGGWTSGNSATTPSSPDKQARYVTRHAALLTSIAALGVAQLVFADPDLSALPQPVPDALRQFAQFGLTDTHFVPKPALAVWDAQFKRLLTP